MSPRPYTMGRRQRATEETRARILTAAREQLADDIGAFSIEAVATRAGVARMTVYYQFRSKSGLLEEVFNDLGGRHFRSELPALAGEAEPLEALDRFIDIFFRFWSAERLVVRRIRGVGSLDPDFEKALRGRDARRRMFLHRILDRIAETYARPSPGGLEEAIDVLDMLSSFQTFDSLASDTRRTEETIELVQRLARRWLGLPVSEAEPEPPPAGR